MYKVFLVDDEELVIKSLKATVDWKGSGYEVAGYALSGEEAVEAIKQISSGRHFFRYPDARNERAGAEETIGRCRRIRQISYRQRFGGIRSRAKSDPERRIRVLP